MKLLQRFTYEVWEFALYECGGEYHSYIKKNGESESHTIIQFADNHKAMRWHQELVKDCIDQIDNGVL